MNFNFIHTSRSSMKKISLLIFFLFMGTQLFSQVRVDFEPRTSQQAPNPYKGDKNYNLQGDFQMIGNTNLTLEKYSENENNSSNSMVFVDVDGDPNTVNSSSAQLELGECATVVYAGLYWSGRSTTNSNNSVTANYLEQGAFVPETTHTAVNGSAIGYFSSNEYNLSISRTGSSVYYTLYGTIGSYVQFSYNRNNGNSNRIAYRKGSNQAWINIPSTQTVSNNIMTATLDEPMIINIGHTKIEVTQLQRRDNNSTSNTSLTYKIYGYKNGSQQSKTLYKNQVQFKHEADSYQTVNNLSGNVIRTNAGSSDSYMWVGYADVTNYVRAQGAGNYFAGDLALVEGNGGGTGYYGSWGLVVVYEDNTKPWRDITVFDGYAFIQAITTGVDRFHDLEIDGFRAVQTGPVGVKLGVMAGEGDTDIKGDYFSIERKDGNGFDKLLHPGTTSVDNFFNGSIENGGGPGSRNPYLKNNTGSDVVMFDLDNANNRYIGNNDTKTTFRYGTTQDLYVIYSIVFSVDAFVPEIVGENHPQPGTPGNGGTIAPGSDLEFYLDLLNLGNDSSDDTVIKIDIPYFMHFDSAQIISGYPTYNNTPQTVYWDPPAGAPSGANPTDTPGGTIVWEVGTVPVPNNPETVLGRLEYKLKNSTDCTFFLTSECEETGIGGTVTGTGGTSGMNMNIPISQGLMGGSCPGYDHTPIIYTVDLTDFDCSTDSNFDISDGVAHYVSEQDTMPFDDIADNYPPGTRFFDEEPTAANLADASWVAAHEINPNDGFPAPEDEGEENAIPYYAVTPGMPADCFLKLDITRNKLICFKDPNTSGPGNETRVGVTLLQRAGSSNNNWPMVRKGGFMALESNTKGFVITRMADPALSIQNPQEGMMVYDMTEKCLKIYTDGEWLCYNTPGCED